MRNIGTRAARGVAIAAALATGWAATAPGASAQTLPAAYKDAGVIKSGLNAGYPPLEMVDPKTTEFIGFDIDLAAAMAEKMGVKVEYLNGAFEQMTPALQSHRVDFIMSGFYDTPARREIFDFIDYLKAGAQFYAPTAETDLIENTDLCGKTITTSRGTSYPKTVEKWSEANCVANGKKPIEVIVDTDRAQQLTNLRTGRAVAAVQGLEAVPAIIDAYPGEFRPLGAPISSALMGIAFNKADTELRDAVHAALKAVIEDGVYDELIDKWKLGLSTYTDATLNMGPQP